MPHSKCVRWLYQILSLILEECLSFSSPHCPVWGWVYPEHPQVPSSCLHSIHGSKR